MSFGSSFVDGSASGSGNETGDGFKPVIVVASASIGDVNLNSGSVHSSSDTPGPLL